MSVESIEGVRLLKATEVCHLLGVSRFTLGQWVRRGEFLRPIYLGHNAPPRWRLRDLEAWLDKRKAKRIHRTPRGKLKHQGGE